MQFYVVRQPVFDRQTAIFGYRILMCRNLREYYCANYSDPDDSERLYRQFCLAGSEGAPVKPKVFLEYSDELLSNLVPLFPRKHVVIDCNSCEAVDIQDLQKLKTLGYGVCVDVSSQLNRSLIGATDIVSRDFTAKNSERQVERIKCDAGKRVCYLAYNLKSWDDFAKARAAGYDYFTGPFYLQRIPEHPSAMKSLDSSILRALAELNEDEPSFKTISSIIEHDLNLSYRLLKLVNSSYIAPGFQVKTISQAVAILGLNELNQFMTAMMFREVRTPNNAELLYCSLIRGKLMELLAEHQKIEQKGTEAFFTGIFSMLDVIMKRSMEDILQELTLTENVNKALTGEANHLYALLELVKSYEQADWEGLNKDLKFDVAEQEKLMFFYITALKWAGSLDF